MFRLGLDLHGVTDHMPDNLRLLAEVIIFAKGEVHVITGGDTKRAKERLQKLNFPYTHFFSIQNFLNDKYFHENIGINLVDGKYLYPEQLWDSVKGEYCLLQDIHLHIDDSAEYKEYFKTPFVLFERRRF